MEENFTAMSKPDLTKFIIDKKKELGKSTCVMGYTGQFSDLLQFADIIGDAKKIADACTTSESEFMVFTGWRFFSDISCIVSPDKKTIQANVKNDCPLSERIDPDTIKQVYNIINDKCGGNTVPVAYVAANYIIRSFCGEKGGSTCTPGNALKVIQYLLSQNKSVFFVPANDAFNIITALNLPDDDIFVVKKDTDFNAIPGGKKIYAWNVECNVHSHYTVKDVEKLKEKYKTIKIIGHKECSKEVLKQCDYQYFIGDMYNLIKDSPSGSCWGVGTVDTWVSRVAKEFPEKTIVSFRPDLVCEDMDLTDLADVAKTLQSISDYKEGKGDLKTQIEVPEEYRKSAYKALNSMFRIESQFKS